MRQTVTTSIDVKRSGRVMQLESMFDVPPTQKQSKTWQVDLPLENRDWNIGLIVGPSGAGKSRVARALFGDALVERFEWSGDRALVDDFPEAPVRDVIGLLGAVGFNSPPAWLRPFSTLSVGEQFRVSCARALAETSGLVCLDEFTSTVDRQVAQVASHTIAKTVRKQKRQLVAVTCHYDVEDWLQPDWVYQPHVGEFTWRSLQRRPPIDVEICKVDPEAWRMFAPHHYLSSSLAKVAQCFGAFVNGEIVGFTSYIHFPHPHTKNIKMTHRTVVLPDWQGVGLGTTMQNWLGEYLSRAGYRLRLVTAHPAMVAAAMKSPRWRLTSQPVKRVSTTTKNKSLRARMLDSRRLVTRSFEYTAPARKAAA